MTNWTADFSWSGSPADARKRISEWSGTLEWTALELEIDDATETATATLEVEADTILKAYELAGQIAEDLLGRDVLLQFLAPKRPSPTSPKLALG